MKMATPPAGWQPRSNPWIIAASVMLATFMEVLAASVANVSLPPIGPGMSVVPVVRVT